MFDFFHNFPVALANHQYECVNRGAKYLDEEVPDWYDKIDIETLNIASSGNCICGQLFLSKVVALGGSGYAYWEGLFGREMSLSLGFDRPDSSFQGKASHVYTEQLTSEWIYQIEKRRANA